MSGDQVRGHLKTLILATVAANGSQHGYAIIASLRHVTDGALALKEGAVYPVLHQLEADGLVSSAWSTEGGRRRRTYSLTRAGEEHLRDAADDWRQFRDHIDIILGEVPWLQTN